MGILNKIRVFAAVLVCRCATLVLRALGRGATDFPGGLALKICPSVLSTLAQGVRVIIVTGTNGKTTTSRIIEQGFIEQGEDYFSNKSGANLLSGIVTSFANNSSLFGKCKKHSAIIECDEAALKTVSLHIKAETLVVTNIFRDQLDRFGEITHTLASIEIGIANMPGATLCLNADCSLTYSLAEKFKNRVVTFGVDTPVYSGEVNELSDAKYCIKCKTEYQYSYVTFAHLGAFSCPGCGYHRVQPDVSAAAILETTDSSSTIDLNLFGERMNAKINLAGGYNIYNACAAAAALSLFGLSSANILAALAGFNCGFGRMESLQLDGADVRLILVKNPAGCNQVLNFLTSSNEKTVFAICLNDNAADGRDVSWIWDVEFERLAAHKDKLQALFVSGIRAYDMAVRLKYAGFEPGFIQVVTDYDELLAKTTAYKAPVCIMPTYTALMQMRAGIAKKYNLKDFWE